MQVDPGQLRHKITIKDADGNIIHSCYAAINQTSGTEVVKNNIQFEQATTRFLIRYTKKAISNDNVVCFKGYEYDIQYINDYNMSHEYIEIIAIKRSYAVMNDED